MTQDPESYNVLRKRSEAAQNHANEAARSAADADMIAAQFERAAAARRKRAIIAAEKAKQSQAKAEAAAALTVTAATAGTIDIYNGLALDIMRLMQSAHNLALAAADLAHADPYNTL